MDEQNTQKTKSNTLIYIVIAVLILGVGGYFLFSQNAVEPTANDAGSQDEVAVVTPNEVDSIGGNDAEPSSSNPDTVSESAQFIDYSQQALAQAQADGKTPVVFFWASWCPTCRALEREINNDLSSIPSDVVILRANFDTETELRQQYGVTIQHTLVQVDQDGNEVNKWSGGGLSTLLDNIES